MKTEKRSENKTLEAVRRWMRDGGNREPPLVILEGETSITVRGCRRILSYAPEELLLSMGARALRIKGSALQCSSFSGGALTVTGRIKSVCYEQPSVEKEGRV